MLKSYFNKKYQYNIYINNKFGLKVKRVSIVLISKWLTKHALIIYNNVKVKKSFLIKKILI